MKIQWMMTSMFIFGFLISAKASDSISIVEVHRNIPLSDNEPVYKDFYLSGKDISSLKKGMVVNVYRTTPIKDFTGTTSLGELDIPVGQLKIIFVQGRIAVAREHRIFPRGSLPMIEQIGMMSGDEILFNGPAEDEIKQLK